MAQLYCQEDKNSKTCPDISNFFCIWYYRSFNLIQLHCFFSIPIQGIGQIPLSIKLGDPFEMAFCISTDEKVSPTSCKIQLFGIQQFSRLAQSNSDDLLA